MTELDDRVWEDGWEGHERHQMQRLAALSLPEKLAWLEEAHRLVMALNAGSIESEPDAGPR